ncbi:hypothetical protein BKA58DRAFT_382774 [Alternaria rosae]|uniref:uncharacterized protein n=1 Tax=Alternaria rosae TaxID=1187941 RepID=UPI001E8E315B|nr:uncharacterized protein BKA58DRAFT_382774 [Alternaria rosae]KAH6872798.1 hypothetical protein BKA58DRAFT_382774 [Alternaria rosae]
MSVSPSAVQYSDNANSLSYAATPCIQHYSLSPKPGSMFGKLKKTFSTRKSSKSTNSYSPRDTEGAGHMLGNAPSGAPVNKKNFASHDSGLSPFSYPHPFDSASPATRRPNSSNMNPFSSNRDAPPAYTPGPAQNTPAVTSAPTTDIEEDDPYDFLRSFDTVFLIDDSGSMAGRSWRETGKALEVIAPICTKRDADGIDIYFLNHPDSSIYKNVTSAGTVIEIFQTVRPRGATPTGQRLNKILESYLQRFMLDKTIKPMNIIVITDGVPSDDLETHIISAARKLDEEKAIAHQIGIQFFQVGKEPGAREHLMQLDDGLVHLARMDGRGIPRDIVDTVPFTGDGNAELTGTGILKATMGAINRRWDYASKGIHRK